MAARLNTRLIALAALAVVVVVAIVGAFAVLRYRADATRNVRQGDEFMAAGEYSKALSAYGRAVNKQPSNLQYLEKGMEALRKVTPETRNELRERFLQLQAMQDRRIGIAPNRPASHQDVIQLRLLLATLGDGSPATWQRLEEAGDRMAEALDPDDPARLDGEIYAAFAAMGRRRLLEPAQFDATVARLRRAIAARPEDDMANATLADALIGEGARRQAANRSDAQAAAMIDEGRALVQEALERVPNGPLVAELALREVLARRAQGDPQADQAAVNQAVERVVRALGRGQPAWIMDRSVAALLLSRDRDAIGKAADALATAIKNDPQNLMLRQIQMLTLSATGRLEECREQAEWLLSAPPRPVGVDAWLQSGARIQAATTLFDIEYELARLASPADRPAALARAQTALDRLHSLTEQADEDPSLARSRGRLAALQGRWTDALSEFERSIRLLGEGSARADLLYEAGFAAVQAGETGLARRRLAQSLSQYPQFVDALLLQSELEAQAGETEAARRSLALARQHAPEDERVQAAQTALEQSGRDPVPEFLNVARERFDRGDAEGARQALADAIDRQPRDIRLYRAATFIELATGQERQAMELAKAGLELDPGDQLLNRAMIVAATKDNVDRIVRSAEIELPEGPERTARIYAGLVRASHSVRQAADEAARAGRETAPTLEADARKLRDAANAYAAEALRIEPPPPVVVRAAFEDALFERRFADAEGVLRKEEAGTAPTLSAAERAMLRAQLLLTQAEQSATDPKDRRELASRAVEVLQAAAQRNPESTDLHRMLGQAYARLGNLQSALASLEIAYQQRPTDMGVVETYASVLQALGDQPRLLQVLRAAARQRGATPAIRTGWLLAEASFGDRRVALAERRALHQAAPDDLANGVALASLLLTLPPSRELIVDPAGRERIPADRWAAMTDVQQRAALEGVRREWMDEARKVAQTLAGHHPAAFEIATIRADLERSAGRPGAGLAILKEAVDRAGSQATVQMLLTIGRYQESLGREADAIAAYEQALKQQGPMREADRFLAIRAVDAGRFDVALPHLRAVAAVSDAQSDQLRLAEAHGRVGQLDEAEAVLARTIESFGLDADCAMLDASIAERRLELAAAAGRADEVTALQQRIRASVRRANELRPTDPVPVVGEAQVILGAWRRKPDGKLTDPEVEQAMALLERATTLRADHWPAAKLRAGIMADRGDLVRARAELERFLKLQPLNDEARLALIDVWMRSGQVDRAIAVGREGVDVRPFDARLRRVLGDLYDRSGDLGSAIAEHRRAAELQPTGGTERLVMLMLRDAPGHPPEFANVIALLQAMPDEVKRSVYLEGALAASMANAGQRLEGLGRLRKAYEGYMASIAERPELITGWFDMLWLVFPMARLSEAEAFVRETTGGKPTPFDLRELALRHARSGPAGLVRAEELLRQAISGAAGAPPASRALIFFDLGNVLYAANRCAEAVPVFEEGLALQPNNPGILNNLAYLLATCVNDPSKALPLAQRAAAMSPSEWSFRDTLGEVYARLGQVEAAEREFRSALALSRQASVHIKLATLLASSGRSSEARAELRRALEVDPKAKDLPAYAAAEAASR